MALRRISATPLIVLCVVLGVLYFCRTAFIPIALALLFALLLSGPVERLHARRIPRGLSASLILILVLGALLGSVNLLWTPAQQWYDSAPQTLTIIKTKVKPVASFLRHLEDLRSASDPLAPAASPLSAGGFSDSQSTSSQFLSATRHVIVSCIACVVITLFLLSGGPPMVARMTVALVDDLHVFHVMQLIDQIRAAVAEFYFTQAVLNLALGAATAALMSLFGLPSPVLWGAAAAVLTFIPYAGSALVLAVLTTVALVTFDSPTRIVGVAFGYVALATLGGQVVQPLLVGQRLEINPLVVFIALWFGGLFWGIAGVVIAMPTLLTLKVISQNVRNGRRLRAFLGPNEKSVLVIPWRRWLARRHETATAELPAD